MYTELRVIFEIPILRGETEKVRCLVRLKDESLNSIEEADEYLTDNDIRKLMEDMYWDSVKDFRVYSTKIVEKSIEESSIVEIVRKTKGQVKEERRKSRSIKNLHSIRTSKRIYIEDDVLFLTDELSVEIPKLEEALRKRLSTLDKSIDFHELYSKSGKFLGTAIKTDNIKLETDEFSYKENEETLKIKVKNYIFTLEIRDYFINNLNLDHE